MLKVHDFIKANDDFLVNSSNHEVIVGYPMKILRLAVSSLAMFF